MKIEMKAKSGEELDFTVSGIGVPLANAIRRTAISRIPVLAIYTVTFYDNTTPIFDEYIANRLALVPLVTPDDYTEKDEVSLSIDAEGPCSVYAKDMKSSDRKVKPASGDIPIMRMLKGHTLRLEAKAKLGIGAEHARFQPGIVAYDYNEEKGTFDFHVESFGQIPAVELVEKSAEILEGKCKEFETQLKSLA
ncbi:MAG: DNA-directed RNA polymerase subunit D [Candidatus Micrarchaeota archaeon]|nr:DNA-directed RNA polymerase subunit D [Candidatus Micrarchaeota archaeon]